MRALTLRFWSPALVCGIAFATAMQAQSDGPALYKTNCVLCHSADGSGSSGTGKALKARDLRSGEVQTQSDEALAATITKGRGNMPAFGKKLKPEDIKTLVAYIHGLKK